MSTRTPFRWPAADVEAVRRDYPRVGAEPLAARLGRSNKAVRLKARELGVRPPPTWTEEMDRVLIDGYGSAPTRELAGRFGKTANATKQRAMRLGLDAGRAVTAAEREAVRRLYPTRTARQIAAELYGDGRRKAVSRVAKIAQSLGLRKLSRWPAEALDRVKALHAEGHTDAQIRDRMGDTFKPGECGRLQVTNVRRRFGLPPNADTPHARQARQAGLRNQLRTLGVGRVTELRTRSHRLLAERYGLPADLKKVQVLMVLALAEWGALTVAELKAACGLRPGHRLLCNSAGTTYQADLVDRGLAVRVPTGIAGAVKGPRCRFLLTAHALELLAAAGEGR